MRCQLVLLPAHSWQSLFTFEKHSLRLWLHFPFCSSSTSGLSFELTVVQRLYEAPSLLSFKRFNTVSRETSGSDIDVRLRIPSFHHAPPVHDVSRGDCKSMLASLLYESFTLKVPRLLSLLPQAPQATQRVPSVNRASHSRRLSRRWGAGALSPCLQ